MRSIIVLFITFCLANAGFAAPDYDPIKKAVNDLAVVMNTLATDVPKIHDAAGVAKALDSYAVVNDGFASSIEDFARQNPELSKTKSLPPELEELFKKFSEAQLKYRETTQQLGVAVKKFAADPDVHASLEKFQKSVLHMRSVAGQH